MIDAAAFHDFERAGWERSAEHYADVFSELTTQTAEAMLDAVNAGPGVRLLDVASGPGVIASAAAARGAIVTGLDFSPSMIAQARRKAPTIEFREGDAEALPFDAGSFDVVVMNFGLLHLARPQRAIAAAYRVLRPGGRYAVTVWAAQAAGFGMALKAIEEFGRPNVGLPEGPAFFQFADPLEAQRAFHAAGFHDVSVTTIPLTWRLGSPDAVFQALWHGGVRTAAVLRAQTPEALEKIRLAVRRETELFANGETYDIPMPAVLTTGTR